MGVVLRAYDPRLRREVALKLLHQREDTDAEARMLREAQSMAQLSHPNVVGIYDAETTEQGVMIAMELVVGVPLDRWLVAEPRTYQEVLEVFMQAGRGLVAAHAAGLIHRDFKPANVFMGTDTDGDETRRVRVGDFGLARETGPARTGPSPIDPDHTDPPGPGQPDVSSSVELTATGTIMGTPVYMAPEQHMGQPADERADQFAFCVSLWEAIHAEPPFAGATVFALAYAKQHGDLRPPRTKIPAPIQAAITRGLATDPADRWPDLATLLQQLQPPTRRWGSVALAVSITAAVATTTAVVASDTTSPREARCVAAQDQLDEIWNEAARSGLADDGHAPPRLLKAIDDYVEQLGDKYSTTCAADPPLDALHFDVTLSCLDSRARWVETVADLLTTAPIPDGKPVDKMIDSLTPIDRCAETQWKGRQFLPDDPERRAVALELHNDNTRVQELENAGRIDEAIALADATIARAETSGFPPVLASALFTRSSLAKAEKRFDYAAALLRRVVELRLSIGDREGGIAAATQLVYVRGVLQTRYAEADGWAAVVRGLMGETDVGPVRRGWFFNHVGASMNARDEPEAAVDPLHHAVAELSEGLGPDHKSIADPLSHLANALTKLGRASEALQPALRALELRDAHYRPDSPAITTARLNLASAQRETGATQEALQTLRAPLHPPARPGTPAATQQAALWDGIAEVHDRAQDATAAAAARDRALALRAAPTP